MLSLPKSSLAALIAIFLLAGCGGGSGSTGGNDSPEEGADDGDNPGSNDDDTTSPGGDTPEPGDHEDDEDPTDPLPSEQVAIANAGADQTVVGYESVSLRGSASGSLEGGELSWTWQQIAGPEVELEDANFQYARFEAPWLEDDTSLTFALTVSDDEGRSASDKVEVLVLRTMYSGAPLQANPEGFGPSIVDYIRMGNSRLFVTPGYDEDGDHSLYFTHDTVFQKVADPNGLSGSFRRSLLRSTETLQQEGLFDLIGTTNPSPSLISFVTSGAYPQIDHAWQWTGDETFRSGGGYNTAKGYYFVGNTSNDVGYTQNLYRYWDGIERVTQYDIPSGGGTGALAELVGQTSDAVYIHATYYPTGESSLLKVDGSNADQVKYQGELLNARYWAGHAGDEAVYVVGYEADGSGYDLYKVEGTDATKLHDWEDYNLPTYFGSYRDGAYLEVGSYSRNTYLLLTINANGTVEELPYPLLNGESTEVKPIMSGDQGTWFLNDYGRLYFHNVQGWHDVGIYTDRLVDMGGYYLAGGYRSDPDSDLPRNQDGIFHVDLDITSMYPRVELIWEAQYSYNETPTKLTFLNNRLYFTFGSFVDQQWQGPLYVPYTPRSD